MQTVYIVEDDLNIQEIEMYALRTGGFEARGFGEAESFYEAVREKKAGSGPSGYHASG